MRRYLLLCLSLFCIVMGKPFLESSCDNVECKAGRECKLSEDGVAECVCIEECPTHEHPVCGSDDRTYVNHCYLHQEACLTHRHIGIKHKGHCKNDAHAKIEAGYKPVACFQEERDLLRSRIIIWLQSKMKSPDISRWTSSYNDLIFAEFYTCDANKDSFIDANEFLECVKHNATIDSIRLSSHADLMRALCIDAIMDIADKNHDWKLDYTEFRNCMDPNFTADTKQCALEDKKYADGTDITVDCNHCICACGNWVCTSASCKPENKSDVREIKLIDGVKKTASKSSAEDFSYSLLEDTK